MSKTDTFTVPIFANKVGVSRNTVTRWVRLGLVKAIKQGPFPGKTSPMLIPASELERVLKLKADESKELSKSS